MSKYRMLKDVEAAIDVALDRFDLPNDEAVRGRLHNQVGALPSADVVEVVRCKDCKYYVPISEKIGECKDTRMNSTYMSYCSYGERKDGERTIFIDETIDETCGYGEDGESE